MNIRNEGMWPRQLPAELQSFSPHAMRTLLDLRRVTYQGFAAIEEHKGLLKPKMSLATTQGQEAVRILFARGIEELMEAYNSNDRDHVLEELIDAINYFWSIAVIDQTCPSDKLCYAVYAAGWHAPNGHGPKEMREVIFDILQQAHHLLERLRNRAWMVNSQSTYFDGWLQVFDFICSTVSLIANFFTDWKEFAQYYVAKNNVLQFRLQTAY